MDARAARPDDVPHALLLHGVEDAATADCGASCRVLGLAGTESVAAMIAALVDWLLDLWGWLWQAFRGEDREADY